MATIKSPRLKNANIKATTVPKIAETKDAVEKKIDGKTIAASTANGK